MQLTLNRSTYGLFSCAAAMFLTSAALAQKFEPRVIRVGYAVAQNSHCGAGVDAFARELAELTNGRFKVEHLDGGKAGGELELFNKVKSDEIEMANSSLQATVFSSRHSQRRVSALYQFARRSDMHSALCTCPT